MVRSPHRRAGDDTAPEASPEESIDLEEAFDDPEAGARSDEVPSLAGEILWQDEPGEKIVVVFAGGKGGTGRSLLAANLGVFVSRLGREVVVADLDPAGANLHTYLGLEPLLPTPGSMLRPPGPPRVDRVPGMSLRLCRPPRAIEPGDDALRAETAEMAKSLEADVLIMDLGLQADPLTLDAFLGADAAVLALVPEPAGVERAYAFVRAALFRRLLEGDDDPAVVARAVLAADHVGQLASPAHLVEALSGAHPDAAEAIRARVLAFSPYLLVNKCRTRADVEMVDGMVSALRRRWGITAEPLAAIEYDDAAWTSTRQRRPFMLEYPGSNLAQGIERMARRLLAAAVRRGAPVTQRAGGIEP
jgi:flagellar biosynthesis protein FlhG